MKQRFTLTEMGIWVSTDSTMYRLSPPKLNTTGHDYIIFQDARDVNTSRGTQNVVRYHDGLPLLAVDTTRNERYARLHNQAVIACAKKALFVCNSTSSVEDLSQIAPEAAERATVIPYFVPTMQRLEPTRQQLEDIATTRISRATYPDHRRAPTKEDLVQQWFSAADDENSLPPYIMTLSTIEPRKNISALISAWQRLREKQPKLRLLINGKPGWEFEQTLEAMRPFVERGQILHLERTAQRELRYLYSGAKCFVFPSFAEGFGLPPVEAMQCGCPVAVSDIPAHRYMANDAALFFDPYDRADIAEKIEMAMDENIAAELRAKGHKNAERFTVETVLPQWEAFFEKHRKKK